jgi:hypothetical protein
MSKLLLAAALAVGAAGAVQAHATLETAEAPFPNGNCGLTVSWA